MKKEIKVKFGGFLVGIFLALLLLELLIRIFDTNSISFSRTDKVLGYTFLPNAYYKYNPPEDCPGWGSEGVINSHGLRDYEYNYLKPTRTFRILALGDSTTEGFQHPLEITWTKVLEKYLNERGDAFHYEVINAGRSGMGTAHEYLFFTHEGYRYSPDLVILLFASSDIVDNSFKLSLNKGSSPYFKIINNQLVLDDSFNQSLGFKIRSIFEPIKTKSYLVSFLARKYNEVTRENTKKDSGSKIIDDSNQTNVISSNSIDIDAAINLTQRLLIELNKAVLNHGSRLVVFNITDLYTIAAQPNQLLVNTTGASGIPYYDLFPSMDEYRKLTGIYMNGCIENNGEGHWNQAGHTMAARLMYEFLLSQQLLPKK